MKPKVAELERRARGYDQVLLHSDHELAPLLRLARAVKEYGRIWAFGPSRQGVEVLAAIEGLDWGPEGES